MMLLDSSYLTKPAAQNLRQQSLRTSDRPPIVSTHETGAVGLAAVVSLVTTLVGCSPPKPASESGKEQQTRDG